MQVHEIIKKIEPQEKLKRPVSEQDKSFLDELLLQYRPKTIVAVGQETVGILDDILKLWRYGSCNFYLIDEQEETESGNDTGFHTLPEKGFKKLSGSPFPELIELITEQIDCLILDARGNSPKDLLDFLVAFPHLNKNAIVVIQDGVGVQDKNDVCVGSSILLQNISANKFSNNIEKYPDITAKVELCNDELVFKFPRASAPFLAGFQLDSVTETCLNDLFVALWIPWQDMPAVRYLTSCEKWVEKHYESKYLQIFRQAVVESYTSLANISNVYRYDVSRYVKCVEKTRTYTDMIKALGNSLLQSFEHVLLFGKGWRGKQFLMTLNKLDLKADGFIVSDGRSTILCDSTIPVYEFSKIPYSKNDTIIIQTADSDTIEDTLKKSAYHWIKFSDDFWDVKASIFGLLGEMLMLK